MDEEPGTSETVAQIVSGDDKKARILKELMLADLGITDVTIKNTSGKIPVITTTHRIINEDGTTEYFQLLMEQESVGTQHFFARIGGCGRYYHPKSSPAGYSVSGFAHRQSGLQSHLLFVLV